MHEWNGSFRGESVRYKMTSVCGHVMSLDFIGKYNNWDRVDPVRNSTVDLATYFGIGKMLSE